MKSPVNLDLGTIAYNIGEGALEIAGKHFTKFSKCFLLEDENTERYCLPVFKKALPNLKVHGIIRIQSGEVNKNIEQCIIVWEQLTKLKADRDSILINLGGGVISDIGGFVAATYKRGIHFVNIPTTLLGQIDAAIGGKTGVDFMGFKNQVGLFIDPMAVVVDPIFLKTLDDIFWQSGFAELMKYGLIMDRDLWAMLIHRNYKELDDEWNKLIMKAAKDKIDIVRFDNSEKGIRKILNFGHTIGHAIETFYLKKNDAITHGQAIAAGMICETWLSSQLSELEGSPQCEIWKLIDKNFDRLDITEENISELLHIMKQDKKIRKGKFRFSLLRRLGKAIHDVEVDDSLVIESLQFYIQKQNFS